MCLLLLYPPGQWMDYRCRSVGSSTPRGVASPLGLQAQAIVQAIGTSFSASIFLYSCLLTFSSVLFYSCCSHARECSGKQSCTSSQFPIAILNGICFFRQCNYKCRMCVFAKKYKYLRTSTAGHYRDNLPPYFIAISFSLSFYLIKCFPLVLNLSVSRYFCSKISDNR